MDLARGTPYVGNWRRLMKELGTKGIVEYMALQKIMPWGFEIENERHIHKAIFAKVKRPSSFGHKPPRSGPMTVAEIQQANREAGR